jgi:hypothetical protein
MGFDLLGRDLAGLKQPNAHRIGAYRSCERRMLPAAPAAELALPITVAVSAVLPCMLSAALLIARCPVASISVLCCWRTSHGTR